MSFSIRCLQQDGFVRPTESFIANHFPLPPLSVRRKFRAFRFDMSCNLHFGISSMSPSSESLTFSWHSPALRNHFITPTYSYNTFTDFDFQCRNIILYIPFQHCFHAYELTQSCTFRLIKLCWRNLMLLLHLINLTKLRKLSCQVTYFHVTFTSPSLNNFEPKSGKLCFTCMHATSTSHKPLKLEVFNPTSLIHSFIICYP